MMILSASSALSYLKLLEDQNIIFSVSCLGNINPITKSIEGAEEIIIKSANFADEDLGHGFQKFLHDLKAKNFSSHKVIIFAAKELFENKKLSSTDLKLINSITSTATSDSLSFVQCDGAKTRAAHEQHQTLDE